MTFSAIWLVLSGNPIFKWFKDNIFLLLLLIAGCGAVYFAVTSYLNQVRQLAVAQQTLVLQRGQIDTINTEFGNFRTSTQATLESMKGLKEAVARVEEAAKQRDLQTKKKLEDILKDTTLTPEQKDVATARVYVQSLRSTYCLYEPAKCTPAPTEEKKP